MRRLLLLAATILAPTAAAQWSADPMVNLTIADRPAGQVQPKVVFGSEIASDPGSYVSWFGGGADGYDVYLQRLDARGVPQWADDGLRVADRSYSSTQDYGLASRGDAFLAFRVSVGGTDQVGVRRVAPDGTSLWGDLVATADPAGANSPKIVALGLGGAVIAWTSGDGSLHLQRLSDVGTPMWGAEGVAITPPSGTFFVGGLATTLLDEVIVAGQAQLSFSSRRLWAQKFSPEGVPMWGATPVEVFDGTTGALQLGYFPAPVSDGHGGAAFAWYAVSGASGAQVYVQVIRANGTPAFPANGLAVATSPDRRRFAPALAVNPIDLDLYVAWPEETASLPRLFGVAAQRIGPTGTREWTDAGVALAPLGDAQTSQVTAVLASGAEFAWATGSVPQPMTLSATSLTFDGSVRFGPVVFKTAPSSVSRLQTRVGLGQESVYVWSDGEPGIIKGQNVRADGTLGLPVAAEPAPTTGLALRVAPHPVAGATVVTLTLDESSTVRLDVIDALGRRVATLADGDLPAGETALPWDARALAPGVYVARLMVGAHVLARRVVVAR